MSNKDRVSVITLGCSKNTVDSERLLSQLKLNEFEIVDAENAGTVIINTCGFIEAAKEESINTILHATELKKQGKINKVIVSGCLSERYKSELENEIPEVDSFFGTESYKEILEDLGGDLKYELLGEREITTPKHYAYLKISEGCDNPCSFCAIPIMRGKHKSRIIDDLVFETELLASKGVKELIIIGQDTTDYGIDIYGKRNLAELLEKISLVNGIEWIRLMYAYPSHFPDSVVEMIANNEKICKYIDIPLQHIADNVLKSMRRGITKRRTIELLSNLKKKIPHVALRTTFISGYPNESDKDFEELCDFVKEFEFDRFGVFNYSPEENTFSYDLGDPIPEEVKEDRKATLMEIHKEISEKKNGNFIGGKLKVLIDDFNEDYYFARSERDAPEVDCEVLIKTGNKKYNIGGFYTTEIIDHNEYDLIAK